MTFLRSSAIPLVVSYVVLMIMSLIVVILRFISKRILQRNIKGHDMLCVVSLVSFFGYAIDTLIGTIAGGIGLHIDQVPSSQLTTALTTFFASQLFWETSISSFRMSILLLYIELFPKPMFRWCAYGCACIVGLFYIGSMITTLTLCQPLRYSWNKTIPGSCGNLGAAEMAAAAINMVLDVVIVLLPLPIVWRLQMPTQRKLGITVTFALGLSIAGINLGRIIKVVTCSLQDFTYCTRDSAILTVAEMAVGIIVACVPTFGPIFSPRRFASSARNQYTSKNGDTLGSGTHVQLHSYRDDSFGGQSLQGLQREELDLGSFLRCDDSRSHTYVLADTSKPTNLSHNAPDGIGVKRVIDVTSDSPAH